MAAVPLFRDTDMVAVTSREKTLYVEKKSNTFQNPLFIQPRGAYAQVLINWGCKSLFL